MPLTEAQYQAYGHDVLVTNQVEFAQEVADHDWGGITEAYNLLATPDFWVWRTRVLEQEVYEATVEGQSWNWATYKAQTVQDRDAWARMFNPGVVNPSLPQTRNGWFAIFGGQGASQVQVTFLLTLARRKSTRIEKLLANTSAGAGTPASVATLTFEGAVTYADTAYAVGNVPLP